MRVDPTARCARRGEREVDRGILERVGERTSQRDRVGHRAHACREALERLHGEQTPAQQTDEEGEREQRGREREQPRGDLEQPSTRLELACADAGRQHRGAHGRDRQHRGVQAAHARRRRDRPLPQARDHADHHHEDRDDPERSQRRVDQARVAVEDEQRVRRTVAHAARVRARQLELLGQQEPRREQRQHDDAHRGHEQAIRSVPQAPGRERQEEVDEQHLHRPAGHAADRVEQLVRGLGERRQGRPAADRREQYAEALVQARGPGVEADRDRGADDQGVCKRDEARRGGRLRRRHGGDRDAGDGSCAGDEQHPLTVVAEGEEPARDREAGGHGRSVAPRTPPSDRTRRIGTSPARHGRRGAASSRRAAARTRRRS